MGRWTGQRLREPARQRAVPGEVREEVLRLLAGTMAPTHLDRRAGRRFPFPKLVYLQPADAQGNLAGETLILAAGRHLSEEGLGFFHSTPVPFLWGAVSLEGASGEWRTFLMELRWCRFIRQGWYESGGRFTKVLEIPDSIRELAPAAPLRGPEGVDQVPMPCSTAF